MNEEQKAPAVIEPPSTNGELVPAGFTTTGGFVLLQRAAQMLAQSTLMPEIYRNSVANCGIVVELAMRMQASPIMVAQNLYIVHGKPAWSSQFLIACVNQCGRFSALQYEWCGTEGQDDWGCRAYATEKKTNQRVSGPRVTIAIAKAEKWYGRDGSKWKTLPELMLMYRSATFFARTHAPELTMGLPARDEVEDTIDLARVDTETGEVFEAAPQNVIPMPQRKSAASTSKEPATPAASEPSPAEPAAGPSPATPPASSSGSPPPTASSSPTPTAAAPATAPAPASTSTSTTSTAAPPTSNGQAATNKQAPKPLKPVAGQAYRILRVWQPESKRGYFIETDGGLAYTFSTTVGPICEQAASSNARVTFEGAMTDYAAAPFKVTAVHLAATEDDF